MLKKKCLPSRFTVLISLIILLFATSNVVEAVPNSSELSEPTPVDTPSQKPQDAPVAVPDDSVLRLIPKGALGVIYCASLLELDNKINALVAELSPTLEIPDVSVTSHAGQSILHNRVEIKSYIFPDLNGTLPADMPEDISGLLPTKWHWYYAFTEGQLLFATGTGPEALQMELDRRAGNEKKFSEHPSYQKLVEKSGTDSNIFVAMSPAILAKNSLPMLGKMDPDNAAVMQILSGLFMNLPENYSIGFSAKRRDSSIDAKLLLDLGDFKQLIQMMSMMTQMGQRQ